MNGPETSSTVGVKAPPTVATSARSGVSARYRVRTLRLLALTAASIAAAPLFPVAPFFTATLWYSAANYYRVHKKSHVDLDWAKRKLPWHYDHHMGPDQNLNWCVTRPWFDHLLGTRAPYLGTEREAKDAARKARLKARRRGPVAAAA